ncbi:hypothetical protein BIY30_24490 [Gibbsiella quercinecans]|nr:hypothetical protein BIY30_24490 [Gibbsiella quercinecans]
MAAKVRAPIVPVHISGNNSALFYLSSLVYRPLSSLLLVREMFRQRGFSLKLQIGARIPYARWHDGHTHAIRAFQLADRAALIGNSACRPGAMRFTVFGLTIVR